MTVSQNTVSAADREVRVSDNEVGNSVIDVAATISAFMSSDSKQENKQLNLAVALFLDQDGISTKALKAYLAKPGERVEGDKRFVPHVALPTVTLTQNYLCKLCPDYLAILVASKTAAKRIKDAKGFIEKARLGVESEEATRKVAATDKMFIRAMTCAYALRFGGARSVKFNKTHGCVEAMIGPDATSAEWYSGNKLASMGKDALNPAGTSTSVKTAMSPEAQAKNAATVTKARTELVTQAKNSLFSQNTADIRNQDVVLASDEMLRALLTKYFTVQSKAGLVIPMDIVAEHIRDMFATDDKVKTAPKLSAVIGSDGKAIKSRPVMIEVLQEVASSKAKPADDTAKAA